jgi:diadenosine tetraphosphate (Ap4A) HIT family hydrolase
VTRDSNPRAKRAAERSEQGVGSPAGLARRGRGTGPSPQLTAFRAKFRLEELRILDTAHWTWSVRTTQPTLGATVLSLRRHAGSFAAVTSDEMADLATAVEIVERSTQRAFRHDKINYLMLMMVDPHVHFHVLPRYASTQRFADLDWQDRGWPAVPNLGADPCAPEVLSAIRSALRG